jgi:hypothetical protein
MSMDADLEDDGTYTIYPDGAVYWHSNYMVEDPVEKWARGEGVVWDVSRSVEENPESKFDPVTMRPMVFHAQTRGGKFEVKVFTTPDGEYVAEYFKSGRSTGRSVGFSEGEIAQRVANQMFLEKQYDKINYQIVFDGLGVGYIMDRERWTPNPSGGQAFGDGERRNNPRPAYDRQEDYRFYMQLLNAKSSPAKRKKLGFSVDEIDYMTSLMGNGMGKESVLYALKKRGVPVSELTAAASRRSNPGTTSATGLVKQLKF